MFHHEISKSRNLEKWFLSHDFDQFILTLERQLLLIEHFLKWFMMRSDSIHLFTLLCIGTLSYTHS